MTNLRTLAGKPTTTLPGHWGAEGSMATPAELRNRGVEGVCIVACDGLKGLPEALGEIWPRATVQLCVVHLVRCRPTPARSG